MRRLVLSPAVFALVACDTSLPERADAGPDVSFASGAYVSAAPAHNRDDRGDAPPPIIRPLGTPAPTTVTLARTPLELRADGIAALAPTLGLVPGLVATLAAGDLALPSRDLALPAGVASLTRAPWLLIDGKLVLADQAEIAESWSAGPPTLVMRPVAGKEPGEETADGGLFIAERPLAADALPSAYRALVGATVKVFDHEREVCVARVGTLGLEARLIHNASGYYDADETHPDHDATEVFEMGGVMLAASLEPVIGTAADCQKGVWAAPVESPAPILFRAAPMDKSLSRLAVRAFRKLDTWATAQHDFVNFYADEPSEPRPTAGWDANAKHTYMRWLASDGSREVLAVRADTWDGCGSSGQTLTALFDVVRTGKSPELRPIASHAGEEIPAALVDLDADGTIELMNEGSMFRWRDGAPPSEDNEWTDERYEGLERVTVPDVSQYGCGC